MSRLHVLPNFMEMNSRDFFYYTDQIQQDVVDEEKANQAAAATAGRK